MLHFLIVCDHIGTTRAALAVARYLQASGHFVIFILDRDGPASKSYKQRNKSDLFRELESLKLEVHHLTAAEIDKGAAHSMIRGASACLITLSPNTKRNVEMAVAEYAKTWHVPVFGYSEVICGHNAPAWSHALGLGHWFDRLFVAKLTEDLKGDLRLPVHEVGPRLGHLRGIDPQAVGAEAKLKLGIPILHPFVWFCGAPYAATLHVLDETIEGMAAVMRAHPTLPQLTIVVTRHARDLQEKDATTITREYARLMEKAATLGLCVIEQSPDHVGHLSRFADPSNFLPLRDLLCACIHGGIVVSLRGLDAMLAAYLRVFAILCNTSDLFDPRMVSEKGVRVFPLPKHCPPQVGTRAQLWKWLNLLLFSTRKQKAYRKLCEEFYRFPEHDAGKIVADKLLELTTLSS